jgi:hypothetical protein
MSPQQDVSVRDLLAVGPAVSAICTPPEDGVGVEEPARTVLPDDEPGGRGERPLPRPQEQDRHQVERFGTAYR